LKNYIAVKNELFRNDSERTWVATFQSENDCQAVCKSLNQKNPRKETRQLQEVQSEK